MVNDNHVDNYLKEILVPVYNGSIVNNRPKSVNKDGLLDTPCRKQNATDRQMAGHWTESRMTDGQTDNVKTLSIQLHPAHTVCRGGGGGDRGGGGGVGQIL